MRRLTLLLSFIIFSGCRQPTYLLSEYLVKGCHTNSIQFPERILSEAAYVEKDTWDHFKDCAKVNIYRVVNKIPECDASANFVKVRQSGKDCKIGFATVTSICPKGVREEENIGLAERRLFQSLMQINPILKKASLISKPQLVGPEVPGESPLWNDYRKKWCDN